MKRIILFIILFLTLRGAVPAQAPAAIPSAQTPDPERPDTPFQFVLLSDTHVGSVTGAEDLRRAVQDINNNENIRFVIISGDITEFGADTEFQLARQILDSLHKPWHIIPGNHDDNWSESGTNSFRTVFGSETFAFSYAGYFFLGNNCGPSMRMGPGQIPHEHILWMDSVLQHLPDPRMPVVFVNHYPQDSALNNWYQVIDLLKQHNTQLILCGHGHSNHRLNFEGIPGVMGRSNLRAASPVGGYTIVRFTGDSAFFTERKPAVPGDSADHMDSGDRPAGSAPAPWTTARLYEHHFAADTNTWFRPSYAINRQYPQVKTRWIYQDKADIGCGIALAHGLVITADTKGEVFALDGKTGKPRWHFATRGKIFSTPYAVKDKLVVASTDGKIYCLQVSSGRLLWKHTTPGPIVASPVIEDDMVYIGSSDGHFRALSFTSGEEKWDFAEVKGFVADRALLYGDKIYFGSWGNEFYALYKTSGQLAWKWSNGAPNRMYSAASCIPVGTKGRIFIVAPDRYMTVLDAGDGRLIWRKRWDSCLVRESMGLSADSGLVYVKTMQGQVLGVSTASDEGIFSWHSELQLGYELDPAAMYESGGILYVPSDKGVAAGIDRASGKLRWIHKVSHSLINTVIPYEEGRVLVSTMDGKIVCLSP